MCMLVKGNFYKTVCFIQRSTSDGVGSNPALRLPLFPLVVLYK